MDKSIKFIYLALIVLVTASCKSQEFETELTIYNKTGKALDSIKIHSLFDKEITYHKVKSDTIINLKYNDYYSKLPRGERGVFYLTVFDGEYFYNNSAGFIGFPGTRLEKKYELYIYPDNIVHEKDFKPSRPAEKKKVSEYISGDK